MQSRMSTALSKLSSRCLHKARELLNQKTVISSTVSEPLAQHISAVALHGRFDPFFDCAADIGAGGVEIVFARDFGQLIALLGCFFRRHCGER